jgi:hypothetical protein
MHRGETNITDLVGEYLQTKEKTKNRRGMVGTGSRKEN